MAVGRGQRVAARVLGARPLTELALRASGSSLRILAYHGVPAPEVFASHMAEVAERWSPVSGRQVADWVDGAGDLPARAVWVTFDDGSATVVTDGLPALVENGVPGTMYVVPTAVEGAPLWWQVIEARPDVQIGVGGRLLGGRPLVTALKQVADEVRREVLARVAEHPATAPVSPSVDRRLLQLWRDAGHEVGNHTWDHPLLDRCSPSAQAEQVRRAHEWLEGELGEVPDLFAYPNGDHTDDTAAELGRLGYRTATLFDHRVVRRPDDRFALSRLRIGADDDLDRARAIISGLHSGTFHLVRR